MNRTFTLCTILAAACTAAAALSASATCVTESHGIAFVSYDQDVNAATNEALNRCQQVSFTNNAECSSSLQCGFNLPSPYPSNEVVCTTESRNLGFQSRGGVAEIDSVIATLVSRCQQVSFTNNSECTADVRCGDSWSMRVPYPSGQVVCTTTSRGLNFRMEGPADEVGSVAGAVNTQCQQNSVTNNSECSGNVECRDLGYTPAPPPYNPEPPVPVNPGPNPPNNPYPSPINPGPHPVPVPPYTDEIVCRTNSHGIPFEARGPQSAINSLTSSVINQCQQNPVTNNSECSQNLHCDPAYRIF